VYGNVPPAPVTVAEPLQAVEHVAFVDAVIVAEGEPAFGTITEMVNVQRLASVIVHVYVPALSADAVAAFPPVGAHE
jgi:hypothetical protein